MQNQADKLKEVESGGNTTEVIAVGIGDDTNKDQVEYIASEPKDENYIEVDDFDSLSSIEDQLMVTLCGGR